MNIFHWGLLTILLCFQLSSSAQRLKKSDRQIIANIKQHMKMLKGDTLVANDSTQQHAAAEYIGKQFSRSGLKPLGDTNTYFQRFNIYEGKEVLPTTFLSLNGEKLKLHDEYFPLGFSANKNAEAAVAIALAENGVPWFKDLKELLHQEDDSRVSDTIEWIRKKASAAADKGASALIVYDSGEGEDLAYDKYAKATAIAIPVLYLKKAAFKHYCSDESEIIDISLNVELQEKNRKGINVVGIYDNHADSTVVTEAYLPNKTDVAALLEVARLIKASKSKRNNYVFVAYCSEQKDTADTKQLRKNSPVDSAKIKKEISLDTVSVSNVKPEGLYLVKQSVDLIKKQ